MSAPEVGLAFDHCSGQGKGKAMPERNGLPHIQPAEQHAEENGSYLQVIIGPSSNPSTKLLCLLQVYSDVLMI